MTNLRLGKIDSELKTCLEDIKEYKKIFRKQPLFAIAVYREGPGSHVIELTPSSVANFLGISYKRIIFVQPRFFGHSDSVNNDSIFLYLRENDIEEISDPQSEIQRQYECLRRVIDQLEEIIRWLPEAVSPGALELEREWWSILFDFAIHGPFVNLKANRERWLNVTGPTSDLNSDDNPEINFPCLLQLSEQVLQFGITRVMFDGDVIPGVIWAKLEHDVYTSTAKAIELLLESIEKRKMARHQKPTLEFKRLHSQFLALAEWESSLHRPTGNDPETTPHDRSCPEYTLIKLSSSFTMPGAFEWCRILQNHDDVDSILLSRKHDHLEIFLWRLLPKKFHELCVEAGTCLTGEQSDHAVMFSRSYSDIKRNFVAKFCIDNPALDLDPAARWIRFVYNTIRSKSPENIQFHFLNHAMFGLLKCLASPQYGYAELKLGIFASSAKAIELANLLPTRPLRDQAPPLSSPDANIPPPRDREARNRSSGCTQLRRW